MASNHGPHVTVITLMERQLLDEAKSDVALCGKMTDYCLTAGWRRLSLVPFYSWIIAIYT